MTPTARSSSPPAKGWPNAEGAKSEGIETLILRAGVCRVLNEPHFAASSYERTPMCAGAEGRYCIFIAGSGSMSDPHNFNDFNDIGATAFPDQAGHSAHRPGEASKVSCFPRSSRRPERLWSKKCRLDSPIMMSRVETSLSAFLHDTLADWSPMFPSQPIACLPH
jgi:hypothetical protein